MASVFDPVIRTSMPQDPMIEQPIQDTVTPALLGTVGKIVVGVARESAVKDLVGDGKIAAESAADASLLPSEGASSVERDTALNSIDTLSKLAAARKAGLPIGEARTRATAILKRAVNDNPLFADDVRKAYNNFFGGTGAGSIFELTAEEKALEKYKEDVTSRSLQLGITAEQAAQLIRKEQQDALYKQDLELQAKERTLNGDSYLNYASVNTQMGVDKFMQSVVAEAKAGPLSPERVQALKAEARMLGTSLKRAQSALLRDENGQPILDMVNRESITAANTFIDTEVDTVLKLLDDQAMLKLSTDNYSVLNNNFNSAVIKNFGQFKAVKDALGEQGAALYFQKLLGNKEYSAVAQQDPFVKAVLAAGGNFKRDFMGATAKAFGNAVGDGSAVSDTAKAGWLGILATDATKSAIKQMMSVEGNNVPELTKLSIQSSPGALAILKRDVWKQRIASDPTYLPVAQSAMEGAAKAARIKLLSDIDSFDLSGIRIEQGTVGVQQFKTPGDYRTLSMTQVPEGIRIIGDNVSSETKQMITLMYEVAKANPSMWEGKAENPVDYVRMMLKFPRAMPASVVEEVGNE